MGAEKLGDGQLHLWCVLRGWRAPSVLDQSEACEVMCLLGLVGDQDVKSL